MINKLLIFILLVIILFNLSYYENFDNINKLNEFNMNNLEKYDREIDNNLDILNNLMKIFKSKISGANINKYKKINKIKKTTNTTTADKSKVQGLIKNAGLV